MPSFNFSIIAKKVSERKQSNKNNIILRDVQGIIWVNERAEYNVILDDGSNYPIHHNCYSCKGHARIYRRGVPFKERYVYIRCIDEYTEQDRNRYLPFAPGCIVRGDLIRTSLNKFIPVFIIRKCWTDFNNENAYNALMFYKEHINEINDIIKKQSI